MEGNFLQRLVRLTGFLLRHPSWIPRYPALLYRHVRKVSPLELGLPWISGGALDALDGFIKPHHRVAEFGGGGSTVYFAERAASVHCLESSEEWAGLIRGALAKRGVASKVEIDVLPFDPLNRPAFLESPYRNGLKGEYDIILVDGYETEIYLRPDCFKAAEAHVKPGGIIIVDDSWRYPELRADNKAKSLKIYRSVGHSRYGVTSSDIYFY